MRAPGLLDEDELVDIEGRYPRHQLARDRRPVRVAGCALLGSDPAQVRAARLLPRSVRVGRKGKHCGSRGLYPAGVVRRVNQVKSMMARNLTIEDIQRSFVQFKQEIEGVSKGLRDLIASFEREAKGRP